MSTDPKPGWRRVRFDQMAVSVNERVDNPAEAGVEHYVGLEHLDSDSLRIRRWGAPTDVEATKLRFRAGDIIFGRRRVYQRKLAVAEFDGICSAHAMVLRARPEVVLPDFLPFFMQSDLFMNRAMEISVGSLSPTINWTALARQEFDLPPLDEQRRIAQAIRALDYVLVEEERAFASLVQVKQSLLATTFGGFSRPNNSWSELASVCERIGDGTHIPPPFVQNGVPFLLVSNLSSGKLAGEIEKFIAVGDYEVLTKSIRPGLGDILYTLVGSYGVPVYVDWDWAFSFQRHIGYIRTNESQLRSKFLYYYLQSLSAKYQADQLATGLAQKTVTLKALRSYHVPTPETRTQDKLVNEFEQIDASLNGIESRRAELLSVRGSLISFLN